MGGVVVLIILWCLFFGAVGAVTAYIEGRVNNQPPRYRNCILWCVLLGIIGVLVVVFRSGLKFAGSANANLKASGEAARANLRQRDADVPSVPTPLD